MRSTKIISIKNTPMVIFESPECISDDIPVVVLDEMNFLSNYTSYPLHKLFVNAKNSEELNMYIDKLEDIWIYTE